MAKELTLDLLEELLESQDPKDIRAQYGEALKANPACAAMLQAFEQIDDDLSALKSASQPPDHQTSEARGQAQLIKPDFGQVEIDIPQSPKKGFGLIQWLVPLAAAIIIGFMVIDQGTIDLQTSQEAAKKPLLIKEAAADDSINQALEGEPEPRSSQIESDMELPVTESLPQNSVNRSFSLGTSIEEEPSEDAIEEDEAILEDAPQVAKPSPEKSDRARTASAPMRKKQKALKDVQPEESITELDEQASDSDQIAGLAQDQLQLEANEVQELPGEPKTYLGKKLEEKRERMDDLKKDARTLQLEQWLERYQRAAAMRLGKELDRNVFRLNAKVRWPSRGKSLIPWPSLSLSRDLQNGRYEMRWQDADGNSGLMELTLDEDGYATILRVK